MRPDGRAEVASQQAAQEVPVLYDERLIEMQLMTDARDVCRGDGLTVHRARRVAGYHVHAGEDDDTDSEEQRNQLHESSSDVQAHGTVSTGKGQAATPPALPRLRQRDVLHVEEHQSG